MVFLCRRMHGKIPAYIMMLPDLTTCSPHEWAEIRQRVDNPQTWEDPPPWMFVLPKRDFGWTLGTLGIRTGFQSASSHMRLIVGLRMSEDYLERGITWSNYIDHRNKCLSLDLMMATQIVCHKFQEA